MIIASGTEAPQSLVSHRQCSFGVLPMTFVLMYMFDGNIWTAQNCVTSLILHDTHAPQSVHAPHGCKLCRTDWTKDCVTGLIVHDTHTPHIMHASFDHIF